MTDPIASAGFAAGVGVAAFFSPCAYALLPGYVGYYVSAVDDGRSPIPGALVRGGAAVVGVVVAFAALAAVTAAAGSAVRSALPALEAGVGAVLVGLGALILTDVDIDLGPRPLLPRRRTSVVGFGLFGALYAVAAAGCVAPLFLAVVVRSFALPPAATLGVFAALTVPFAALLLSATAAIAAGYDAGTSRFASLSAAASRVAGALLVAAGGVQLWLVLG